MVPRAAGRVSTVVTITVREGRREVEGQVRRGDGKRMTVKER